MNNQIRFKVREITKYMTPINFIVLPKDIFYKGSIPCHIIIFDKNLNKKYDLDSNILKDVYDILYDENNQNLTF